MRQDEDLRRTPQDAERLADHRNGPLLPDALAACVIGFRLLHYDTKPRSVLLDRK